MLYYSLVAPTCREIHLFMLHNPEGACRLRPIGLEGDQPDF